MRLKQWYFLPRARVRKKVDNLDLCYRFTRTAKAVVVSCSLAASEQVTVDLALTLYQVQARVLEAAYADDVYILTVVKPEGVGDLIDEEGTFMEDGRFAFDSTEEITIDNELEVEITGIGTATDRS